MTASKCGSKCAIAFAIFAAGVSGIAKADITGFGGNGAGYSLNGGPTVTSDILTLTSGANSQARSAFYNTLQSYTTGGWTANFTYQPSAGSTGTLADGIVFVLQKDSRGASAVGASGGSLAYGGAPGTAIFPSGGFQFNLFGGGGGVGAKYARTNALGFNSTGAVNVASLDPINVNLVFNGSNTVTEKLTDATTLSVFTTSFAAHAADFGGDQYFVGFTGSTGGFNSVQTISNFSFTDSGAFAPAPKGILKTGDAITASSINFPAGEVPANAIDQDPTTKYLNFDKGGSGFTVTPAAGASIVNTITLTSANDSPERDPATYLLQGSNDGGLTFTPISSGPVPAFSQRFDEEDINFANTLAYTTYQLTFPTITNSTGGANSLQIADVQFYGNLAAVPEPASLGALALGGLTLIARRRHPRA